MIQGEDERRKAGRPGRSQTSELTAWLRAATPEFVQYTRYHMGAKLMKHAEPEDIVQDVFHSAWRNRNHLSSGKILSYAHWMKRAIRNRIIDLSRRCNNGILENALYIDDQGSTKGSADPRLELASSKQATTAPHALSHEEALNRIHSLPPEERLCLVLHDFLNVAPAVVAQALGRTACGTKELRRRARERLRDAAGKVS